jgi:hypothetical protein
MGYWLRSDVRKNEGRKVGFKLDAGGAEIDGLAVALATKSGICGGTVIGEVRNDVVYERFVSLMKRYSVRHSTSREVQVRLFWLPSA